MRATLEESSSSHQAIVQHLAADFSEIEILNSLDGHYTHLAEQQTRPVRNNWTGEFGFR